MLPRGGWSCWSARDTWIARAADLVQQKLWCPGRWLHVMACLGGGGPCINVQVVYGIAGKSALYVELSYAIQAQWEMLPILS